MEGRPQEYQPLVSGLVGAAGGAGIGALGGKLLGFGAGRGALAGLGLGGIGGALYGSHAAGKQYGEENDQELAKRDKQHTDAVAGMKAQHLSDVASLKKNVDEANQTISERDKSIADNMERIRSLTGELAGANDTVSARNKSIAELKDQVKALKSQSASDMANMNAQLNQSKKDLLDLGKQNTKLQSDVDTLRSAGIPTEDIRGMTDAQLAELAGRLEKAKGMVVGDIDSRRTQIGSEQKSRMDAALRKAKEDAITAEGLADIASQGAPMLEKELKQYSKAIAAAARRGDLDEVDRLRKLMGTALSHNK